MFIRKSKVSPEFMFSWSRVWALENRDINQKKKVNKQSVLEILFNHKFVNSSSSTAQIRNFSKKEQKKISYVILVINLTSEPMSESKKRGKEKQFVKIAYTNYVMYEFNLALFGKYETYNSRESSEESEQDTVVRS